MIIFEKSNNIIYTGRGTTALWAILKSLNMPGAGVLIPVNICEVVVAAILKTCMKPIYYDVHPIKGNGELKNIKAAFKSNVGVLIIVHNYGTPMDIATILPWAQENKLFIIEDVCNSLGAVCGKKDVGIFADAAIYSFGYEKIIDLGVGGAALIKDINILKEIKKKVYNLDIFSKKHIQADRKYQSKLRLIRKKNELLKPMIYKPLYSEYMDYLLFKIDSTVIRKIKSSLKNLRLNIMNRKKKAQIYREKLNHPLIQHRPEIPGEIHWRYTFLVSENKRDKIVEKIQKNNLPISTWFPPVHILFEEGGRYDEYPDAYSFAKRVVNLWVNNKVNYSDINKTIHIIQDAIKE